MNRRDALLTLLALLPARAATGAPARLPRIGYLLQGSVTDPPSRERQAFLDGLRALGHLPGKSVELVYGAAEGAPEFLDEIALDLVARPVDLLVTSGSNAAQSAARATRTVPVVMLAIGDPVGIGIVRSLARPGVNVTGVSFISSDLAPKRVELMRELVPNARRVAIVWDARNANARSEAAATSSAAKSLGLAVEPLSVQSDAALARALEGLGRRRPDVLYVAFEGGLVAANRTLIAEFGLRHRVAVISGWSFLSDAGGLLSYAPDIPSMFGRAAHYVDRILRGERPEAMPIELPTRIELVVNLATARRLGIAVPQSILLRADRVIE